MSMKNYLNFSFVVVGRITSAGLQAIFYLIFASILDPTSYGNLSYLIALAGSVSIFSRFGLNQSVTITQAKNNFLLSNSINLLALILTLISSILLLTIDLIAGILCFGISLFIMNIHNMLGLKKYKKYMIINLLTGIFIIFLSYIFYSILDIPGILLGMTLGYLLLSIDSVRRLTFKKNFVQGIKNNSKMIIHNFGADFSIYAPKFLDKLVIFPILGFMNLGIYQLNMQILFALEMIPLSLHSFLLSEESSGKKHTKITYFIIITSIGLAVLSIVIAPYFIQEFFSKYSDGIPSLQLLVISIIPLTISSILTAKLQAKESTMIGYSALVRVGSLLLFIAFLGGFYDLLGLAMAVILSTSINSIFLFLMFRKLTRD